MKTTIAVPLFIILFFSILTFNNPPAIDEHIETILVDYRFKIRNLISPPHVPDDILIVFIDEKSYEEYGKKWPWPRDLQAELIEKIFEGSPRFVAVDIFYPQEESPEADKALADVFQKYRDRLVVALGFQAEEDKSFDGEIDDVLYDSAILKIKNQSRLHSFEAFKVMLPVEPIASSSNYGHVNTMSDRDSKLRLEYLYIKYGEEYFPSLALQTVRIVKDVPMDKLSIIGGRGVDLDGLFIPTDMNGRMHINYIGKEGLFHHWSAIDVLKGRIPKEVFRDKIILVGTSAVSAHDQKATPFSASMPGVEKNATVIANIMRSNFLVRSPLYFDLLLVLIAGITSLFLTRRQNAMQSIAYYICLIGFILIANQAAFTFFNTRVNLFYPLMTVMAIGTFVISHRYFIEEKKARDIRKMFSSYVTERVVNELIKNPEMAKLGGERREVTVLFSDVVSFASFSEKHDPEYVVEMLNEYLTSMTDIVFRWEGTLDKFIGDAIVAFWGAPLRQDNHAELAVRCALNMIKNLEELSDKWESEGKDPLSIGIGLNTGEVLVGNIGAEGKKMDYTVIGDHVNLGARVESLTRKYKTNILMTELPLEKVRELVDSSRIGHVSIKGVGNVVVKGRQQAVKIYEIKSLDPNADSVITECADDEIVHFNEK